MRILAYFAGWLLALPGLLLAALFIAVDRVVALRSVVAILWEALNVFAYGLPLAGLVLVVLLILGFFRAGRMIGSGALLVGALGALAVILERSGAPEQAGELLFVAPIAAAAVIAGWLLHAESQALPPDEPPAAIGASR